MASNFYTMNYDDGNCKVYTTSVVSDLRLNYTYTLTAPERDRMEGILRQKHEGTLIEMMEKEFGSWLNDDDLIRFLKENEIQYTEEVEFKD